jgi:dephospho-CoA kinase
MSFKLGLTGSIGMGKSTTAAMFVDLGCAVWDADAAVHRLYAKDGAAVAPIAAIWPGAIVDGALCRTALREIIADDPTALPRIEQIVHPLVFADRQSFVQDHADQICVFDIPILFETGGDREMDATACVRTAPDVQRARVLARGTMSEADLDRILARQMPNDEKCARADYIIDTDTLDGARTRVAEVVADIEKRQSHA